MKQIKGTIKILCLGFVLPILFLFNGYIIPEPYSHPLINLALSPMKLMPFTNDHELMTQLTISVFGKLRPNNTGVLILILIAFWFMVSLVLGVIFKYVASKHKSA